LTTGAPERDAGLATFLASRARKASDTLLVVEAVAGAIASIAVAIVQFPRFELVVAAALCVCAFGSWGIADRELGEPRSPGVLTLLKAGRVVAATVGFAAAAFLLLFFLGVALGTIIS
jgi:hypothetical protein